MATALSLTRFLPSRTFVNNNRDGLALMVLWAVGVSLWQPLQALSGALGLTSLESTALWEGIDHTHRLINVGTPLVLVLGAAMVYRCARRLRYTGNVAQRVARIWTLLLALTMVGNVSVANALTIGLVLGALAPLIKGRITRRKAATSAAWLFAAMTFFGVGALAMWAIPLVGSMLWRASQFKTNDYRAMLTGSGMALGSFVLVSQLL
ncbi:hypothetical protein [Larsenimonas rhizosphaerae]|uniref:Uncharacterized protein n=1 Tax=Larsenimonas rhizosphaerae TaxID=2944682 RepID=A0AA42CXS6_9GAMM|nr:hypothetical protein [Larsenimonas rhizosphaerae]MCM2129570.1 hypothetical protein [Larsenimonas rhizosphaerae]MCX2524228.1 hypothetical protein [Larsenimonas rhizosphaerae]